MGEDDPLVPPLPFPIPGVDGRGTGSSPVSGSCVWHAVSGDKEVLGWFWTRQTVVSV